MKTFGIKPKDYDFNWDRWEAWIEFTYKGERYRFHHSVAKAQAAQKAGDPKIQLGSDCFAQIVMALEDLARMTRRGVYDLAVWVSGMKALPPPVVIPPFLRFLEFDRVPQSTDEVEDHFKVLAKRLHPDAGGSAEAFQDLIRAREQALQYLGTSK